MKNDLNKINNKFLIKINKSCDFIYTEDNITISSPVSDYYFKYSDLSINISLRLKWALHGYFFLKSILETLDDPDYRDDISFEKSINKNIILKQKKKLLIDNIDMEDFEKFKNEMEIEYSKPAYTANALIHFKLMVNIDEFVILNHALIPRLIFFQ